MATRNKALSATLAAIELETVLSEGATVIRSVFLACLLAVAASLPASAYDTPERGSQTRTDIMDAARTLAEWAFGAPVEFVVNTLRVDGRAAFLAVSAQRPGGGPIDLSTTPLATRDAVDTALIDGPRMEVLFLKSGTQWVPVQHSVGATDVWYSWDAYCGEWGAVLPDFCKN